MLGSVPIGPTHLPAAERKRLGAWYTPPALVAHLVDLVLTPLLARAGSPAGLRVLDPACGDGRFLVEAARRIGAAFGVGFDDAAACCHGMDVDAAAVDASRRALGAAAHVIVADATTTPLGRFDAVLGNPPFLSPLVAASGRRAGRVGPAAPYADAAAAFLALAVGAARADGGRLGLVLPQSIVASRDAGWARRALCTDAVLEHLWWSPRPEFDAAVRAVAVVAERGGSARPVARTVGLPPVPRAASPPPAAGAWSSLLLDLVGIPDLPPLATAGLLGERAEVLAGGFRDQFYALAPLVDDHADGPPLVTTGLLDVGACRWGERPTRVGGRSFRTPRVPLAALAEREPRVLAWAGEDLDLHRRRR
jgi:SAM-dependent methyltransferase